MSVNINEKSHSVRTKDKLTILTHHIAMMENILTYMQVQDLLSLVILGLRIDGHKIIMKWAPETKQFEYYDFETDKEIKIDYTMLASKELDSIIYTLCCLCYSLIPEIPLVDSIDPTKVYQVERPA